MKQLVRESLYEYLELPGKSQDDIIMGLSKLYKSSKISKIELNKNLLDAARNGLIDVVEWLLSNEADINYKNNNGDTALHLAAIYGHNDLFHILFDAGADTKIKDIYGLTAISYFISNRWK